MQSLIAAMNASLDPAALMRRIAEQMCLLTPKAGGAAVSILTSENEFVVVSAHGLVESLLGLSLPREGTMQGRAIATGQPQVSMDALNDSSITEEVREIGARLGIKSLVVIPLLHRAEVIGALSLTASEAFEFNDRDVAAMAASGRFISALIGAHTEMSSLLDGFLNDPNMSGRDATARFIGSVLWPELTENDELHQSLDDLMGTPSNLRTAFQPIVDLDTGAAVGFEALSRFPEHYGLAPRKWFDIALRLGRSLSLEVAALERALASAAAMPHGCFIAVNLSPLTAMDPAAQEILLKQARPLVVEITEHEPFPDNLADALKPLRDSGIRLAIDDAGAGFASFTQMLRVRPDIIKIDGTLTAGIDDDPIKRALVSAVVRLAEELDAVTVAEAVEEPRQAHVLQQLGVRLSQGYLFGRPEVPSTSSGR
ncbi:EAL domain-containing protein [Mycobacterium sp. pW049]|uniref:sensor domain-containing phosphodiesterase n=1 Tax=[Mycobacterium] bulgaricum TaxID=3238985 RepID=UPI00351AE3FC